MGVLLIHLCSAQTSVSVQKGWFPLLGGSWIFFQVCFFFSKGHCAQDALFVAACQWCEGRRLAAFGCAADSLHQSQLAFAGHPFLLLFSEAFFFFFRR